MLIASVSDIHADYAENRDVVVAMACELHRRKPAALIVAGDISHRDDRIDRVLRAFREVVDVVAYTPGNHELWFDVPSAKTRSDLDTWRRYRVDLEAIVERAGAQYLPARPLIVDNVAIVGTCGWYDYSFFPPAMRNAVSDTVFEKKQYGGITWSDARFIAFRDEKGRLMSDGSVAEIMERDLRTQLGAVDDDPKVEHVVAVTHHQPFYEVVARTGTLPWEFFNAFMGSVRLGDAIRAARKVRNVVYGHTHLVGEYVIDGIRVFGTPLGYPREWRGFTIEDVVRTRMGWIET